MDRHRRVSSVRLIIESLDPPFSSFDCIESRFGRNPAIHRCFSLARSFNARILVTEDIPATGLLADEDVEIASLFPSFQPGPVKRLSFWREPFKQQRKLQRLTTEHLVGYAIVKQDVNPGGHTRFDGWHVFEAVFPKFDHRHNFVPTTGSYTLHAGEAQVALSGVLYAQQNGLNKVCAHVALRSLLSRLRPGNDLSYRDINAVARTAGDAGYRPENGLSALQIRAVLEHYGVNYRDVDYEEAIKADPDVRKNQPYQKYLYSGIESGYGGLLGFSMSGPAAVSSKHIIPFYGHTFNKDTWAPDAEEAYFNIGGGVGYIPSETWTSSFIGHDDNFGPNFCIPRLYVHREQVAYVVELLPAGATYNGIIAEARALQFIYSLYPHLDTSNAWSRRLAQVAHPDVQRVILRATCIQKDVYLEHLRSVQDWSGKGENPVLVKVLANVLPKLLWVVEISIPHLFAANERKVGEIVLHATQISGNKGRSTSASDVDFSLFLLARLPGQYFFLQSHGAAGPVFSRMPSAIKSHVPVLELQ